MIDNPSVVADVLIEILLRLSINQVCQLKILSKEWLLIISSHHFKRLYNERSIRRPRLLVVEETTEGEIPHFRGPRSRILHISTIDIFNGVILREFSLDAPGGRFYKFNFGGNLLSYNSKICNPTTHEHVNLPYECYTNLGLCCGYLRQTNEYKIFGLFRTLHDKAAEKLQLRVLTVKDGEPIPRSWRIIESNTPKWAYVPEFVSINCSLYWLVDNIQHTENNIISIDLNTEKFTTIHYPEVVTVSQDYKKRLYRDQLTEIRGELCLAHLVEGYSTVEIFVLKDHEHSTWVKECGIYLSNMAGMYFDIVGYLPCDEKNGEIIIHFNYEGILMSYNINDKSFRRLGHSKLPAWSHVSIYYDRLFSFGEETENVEEEKKKKDDNKEEESLDSVEEDEEESSNSERNEDNEEEESSDSEENRDNEEEESSDSEENEENEDNEEEESSSSEKEAEEESSGSEGEA